MSLESSDPVVNINVLVDSKKEYVDQLERGLTEPVFESLKNILRDAVEVSDTAGMDPISAFAQLLSEIPEWNPEVLEEETEFVMDSIPYFRDLLKAYFVCTSMIMGSIRMSKDPNQKMKVRVPSPTRFVHLLMKNLGTAIVDEVDYYVTETADGGYKFHRRNLFEAIRESVRSAVHTLMPIDDILKEYMGDILDKETFKGGEETGEVLEEEEEDDEDEEEDGELGETRQVQVKPGSLVNGRKEIGGTFVPDSNGVLHRFTTTAFGHENDVQIPHGTFEWHTHPQRCGMTDCSLSSPSDTDVGIILDDVGTENISHIVFNHSGVFVMTLTPGLNLRLKKEGKRAANAIKKKFTRLQDDFAVKYNKTRDEGSKDRAELWHQNEWMKLARVSGIHVDFFRYGETPYVTIDARQR
eukprot:jgi/Mesvir1/26717/Mv20494-RA.1